MFSFGGGSSGAPATAGFGAATTTGGFGSQPPSFGGAGAPAPTPFFGNPPATGGTVSLFGGGGQQQQQPAAAPAVDQRQVLQVPGDFESKFRGRRVYDRVHDLVEQAIEQSQGGDSARLAGQELVNLLGNDGNADGIGPYLLSCPVLSYAEPNRTLRQQLEQNQLRIRVGERDAAMTPALLRQILTVADELRISEQDAIGLFAYASAFDVRQPLAERMRSPAIGGSVPLACKELYLEECKMPLQTLFLLFQSRLLDDDASSTNYPVEATDALLQKGIVDQLIRVVREYSSRVEQLLYERSHHGSVLLKNVVAHLDFCLAQRETALRTLFYIAYHTQLTGQEVASLVDLLKAMSDVLPVLDPLKDVPHPYEQDPDVMQHANLSLLGGYGIAPFTSASSLKEKDPFVWQRELVQQTSNTGYAPLLRSVSILTATIVSALNVSATLFDRTTHRPNAFGGGNALLPPTSSSGSGANGLMPFHHKICLSVEDARNQWKRPDVLGVITAAYCLLLRSAPSALSSPTSGGVGQGIDLRKSWRECHVVPADLRSFTFSRLGLLPALRGVVDSIKSRCDTSEFLLSVMASFAARYFDVLSTPRLVPISREKWEQEEQEELRLMQNQQTQERLFQARYGTRVGQETSVPSSVDLMDRPDCMDDIVAFCSAYASLGPYYAQFFWSRDFEGGNDESTVVREKFIPSPSLQELSRQQQDDGSLKPCYLAFLSALSLAKDPNLDRDGASVVHDILSSASSTSLAPDIDRRNQMSWQSLLSTIRWYAEQLNPQASSSSSANAAGTSSGTASTEYYYSDRPQPASSSYGTKKTASSRDDGVPKTRELGDANRYTLQSLLSLISNVCASCVAARLEILDTTIAIKDDAWSNEILRQDTSLLILFALASSPLSPEVRGAVFGTIASILCKDGATGAQAEQIEESALSAWYLLDKSQILPISMLEQYPSGLPTSMLEQYPSGSMTGGISFPPSSTALVRSFLQMAYFCLFRMATMRFCLSLLTHIFVLLFRWLFGRENHGYPLNLHIRSSTSWNMLNRREDFTLLPKDSFASFGLFLIQPVLHGILGISWAANDWGVHRISNTPSTWSSHGF